MKRKGVNSFKKVGNSINKLEFVVWIKYQILNALISTIMFVALYKFWIIEYSGLEQLGLLICASIITGIVGSWVSRIKFQYLKKIGKPFNIIMRSVIISVIYSIIIWAGLIAYLFETFNLLIVCAVLVGIKFILFFVSDFMADSISF